MRREMKQMLRSTKMIGPIAKTVADDRAFFKGEEMNCVLYDHDTENSATISIQPF